MNRSLQFYQEIVGFKILRQSSDQAILTADGKTPILTLKQLDDIKAKEKNTTGLYHFALLLPSRSDLSRFLNHLLQQRYRFGASDHEVSEAIYIDDPDGNGIEIYRDRPSDSWQWSNDEVNMVTEPLDGESLLQESNAPWNGLPEDTIMGHIHLHVRDLQETEQFYAKGLGFDVVTRYPGALFMSTGRYHHHFGLNIWNGEGAPAPNKNSAGLDWFTITFANEKARERVVQNVQKTGSIVKEDNNIAVTEYNSFSCLIELFVTPYTYFCYSNKDSLYVLKYFCYSVAIAFYKETIRGGTLNEVKEFYHFGVKFTRHLRLFRCK